MKKLLPFNGFAYLLIITLLTGTINAVSAQCIAPSLTFQNPTLVAGLNGQVGATYKFPLATPTADAYIRIDSLVGGATLTNIDNNSMGYTHAWQPVIKGPTSTIHEHYIRWTISFKVAGSNINTSIPCLNISAIDLDGDNVKLQEFVETFDAANYTVANNTGLTVFRVNTSTGMSTKAYGHKNDKPGIDTTAIDTQINFDYGTRSSVTFKIGVSISKTSSTGSTDRNFSIYFKNIIALTPLPVRLLSFSGRPMSSNSIQLNWVTELEVNNKHFEIQRSLDGKNFQTVAIVMSIDGSGTKAYKLTDNIPAGSSSKVYYRIKQVDLDEKYSISNVITINLTETNNFFVKLAPNPVGNEFSITLENNSSPVSAIRIVDMNGREIFRKNLAGLNTTMHRFDARQANMQKPGLYVAELLFSDGTRSTQKIIKN
jgi:hypothetical protein